VADDGVEDLVDPLRRRELLPSSSAISNAPSATKRKSLWGPSEPR